MRKFGIKLFTSNLINETDFSKTAIDLVKKGKFDFLELMALPDSYEDTKNKVVELIKGQIKVVIHAPHQGQGMNTSDPECYQNNRRLLDSAQRFADLLDSKIIILHVGYGNSESILDENIRQFKLINDERIAVENLPAYYSVVDKIGFHGTSPQEISRVKAETGCKFCYDLCHGICASNAFGRDKLADIKAYEKLKPDMYHLCDSDWEGTNDGHLHYGEGNYDIAKILGCISENAIVTMETGHGLPVNIDPWVKDVEYLQPFK